MKWIFLFAALLALALLSNSQTLDVPIRAKQDTLCGPSVSERIRKYFDGEEIRPTQIVNNTDDPGIWISKTSTIKIGNHTIEWIDKVGKLTSESSLKIDGELITLEDKKGVNNADEDQPIRFISVGQWDQIKLYKFYDGDIIGLTMLPRMCTGLMCGVSAQLMYDVKTKQKTYFGTFRTDEETRLFRITNENNYYYIAKNFDGDPHGYTAPQVITYELYKREPSGKFVVQKNAAGEKYYIKHTILTDMEFDGDTVEPKKEPLRDKLEQNWIKKIN
jgi:hypothetical protein